MEEVVALISVLVWPAVVSFFLWKFSEPIQGILQAAAQGLPKLLEKLETITFELKGITTTLRLSELKQRAELSGTGQGRTKMTGKLTTSNPQDLIDSSWRDLEESAGPAVTLSSLSLERIAAETGLEPSKAEILFSLQDIKKQFDKSKTQPEAQVPMAAAIDFAEVAFEMAEQVKAKKQGNQ